MTWMWYFKRKIPKITDLCTFQQIVPPSGGAFQPVWSFQWRFGEADPVGVMHCCWSYLLMRCLDDLFNDHFSRRERWKTPKRWWRKVREIRTPKKNGPKNMEVTDLFHINWPDWWLAPSFFHQNLGFVPQFGAFLPYFLGPGGMGGVVTSNEMFCGDSYENLSQSWEGLRESQHMCVYYISYIFIYIIYQAYTLYIISIFCIYICIELFQKSRSLVQYICSTMLEGLQKELQWVLKSAL